MLFSLAAQMERLYIATHGVEEEEEEEEEEEGEEWN